MHPIEAEPRNIAAVERALAALAEGDVAMLARLLHPDARWNVSPAGILKGRYRGRDQILGFLAHLADETDGTIRLTSLAAAAAGERVFVLTQAHAVRAGRSFEWEAVLVFTIADGLATAVDHHLIDYPRFARFWS
jgi:ketosteroid isomerase-like protein